MDARARTTVRIKLEDGKEFTGIAVCGTSDNFSRRRGRRIAIGRALQAAANVASCCEGCGDVFGPDNPATDGGRCLKCGRMVT